MGTEFGKRMRAARIRAALSQAVAAEKIGMSQGSLSQLEKGGFGSSYTVAFAMLYGCDPNWLATGEGEPNWRDEKDSGEEEWRSLYREIPPLQRPQMLEEVRQRVRTMQRQLPALPRDLADIQIELDALPPGEREAAYIRAMNAIAGSPMPAHRPSAAVPAEGNAAPAGTPTPRPAPHRR